MVLGSAITSDLVACCWGEVAYDRGTLFLRAIPQLGPWVDSPMILIWDEMGFSPPGSFPLAFLSQEGLTWALQRWRGPWQVDGSIPCWLFICCCELPGKGFLTQLRKNLTAELTANSPQDEVCAHNQEKTRIEQTKGVGLMSSFPATRAWSGPITEYLQTLNQCLLSWPSYLLSNSYR